MKWSTVAAALVPVASAALGFTKEEYDSGAVMAWMMEQKESAWAKQRAAGAYDSKKWSGFDKHRPDKDRVRCINGKAIAKANDTDQHYKCKDIDLYDFKSHVELGSPLGEGSGSWGWEYWGREFYILGQTDGAAFVEIKDGKLVYLGRLPAQANPVIWREIKVAGNYVVIGSEGVGHNIQFFDLRKLLKINPKEPKTFNTGSDLTSLFTNLPVGRSHNVVVNEEKNYAVAVGAAPRNSSCAGGLIFINIDDITKPYSPGCAPQDGYVHDAQCIVYRGPHAKYYGRDICYGYNEDTLTIYDVTNKNGPNASTIISRTPYKGASYSHQGWIINPYWQTHLVLDDELDEGELYNGTRTNPESPAKDGFPVTYIFDITNLEKPTQSGQYKSKVRSVDHNQFIYDGLLYQSNYQAGLRVLDVSSIPWAPSGKYVNEIAYFDVYPGDDDLPGGGAAVWEGGTWSHYTFKSGWIAINTIDRGVFLVRLNKFKGRGFGKRQLRGMERK
ncbi:hypothetical protein B0J11DRAFT_297905 [Dendryphion nanum]|uniref:Uncharacterized protein n=1 Tax=Dendryphion nanum TaxID=256645 RepID=A0A9P9DXX1_9PLEO|nr:hypothetical protein B0J11DRAFT_297905 [Dendryphion nanum]